VPQEDATAKPDRLRKESHTAENTHPRSYSTGLGKCTTHVWVQLKSRCTVTEQGLLLRAGETETSPQLLDGGIPPAVELAWHLLGAPV
jgi:hypothetical protein